jgi:hypothetical protein
VQPDGYASRTLAAGVELAVGVEVSVRAKAVCLANRLAASCEVWISSSAWVGPQPARVTHPRSISQDVKFRAFIFTLLVYLFLLRHYMKIVNTKIKVPTAESTH